MAVEVSHHIVITLPENRYNPGSLSVYDNEGTKLFWCMCLGKADNGKARREGNPTRDPLKQYGDTPTGTYEKTRIVRLPEGRVGIGEYWITLDPIGGDAQIAEDNGRHSLGIHGGRGNDRLVPTLGCIRAADKHMHELFMLLQSCAFSVEIKEASKGEIA